MAANDPPRLPRRPPYAAGCRQTRARHAQGRGTSREADTIDCGWWMADTGPLQGAVSQGGSLQELSQRPRRERTALPKGREGACTRTPCEGLCPRRGKRETQGADSSQQLPESAEATAKRSPGSSSETPPASSPPRTNATGGYEPTQCGHLSGGFLPPKFPSVGAMEAQHLTRGALGEH